MKQKQKRILMSVIGVAVCGISVGMFKYAALGVDPFQSLMSGLNAVIPLRFGSLYVLVNLLLLLFALLLDRRKLGLATLINLFLLGYVAEFVQTALLRLHPGPGPALRFGVLTLAVGIMCLASAFYFTADLGVSPYDAVALLWSERQTRIPFALCRILSDLLCVLLGAGLCLLAGYDLPRILTQVGPGTVITAFFMGPLIQWFNRHVARPFLYGRAA